TRCSFLNTPATTEIYTLSLHDALPIYWRGSRNVSNAMLYGEVESLRSASRNVLNDAANCWNPRVTALPLSISARSPTSLASDAAISNESHPIAAGRSERQLTRVAGRGRS